MVLYVVAVKWMAVEKKKKGKKYIYCVGGGFCPDHPLPLFIRKNPVLEEAFILWLFVLSRERSAIFPPPPQPPPPTRARRHGENKNEKLDPCGENDFLPARLAFFHTAPPGPINTGNHRFTLLHRSTLISVPMSCALKSAGLFSSFSFIFTYFFFYLHPLKINSVSYNILYTSS